MKIPILITRREFIELPYKPGSSRELEELTSNMVNIAFDPKDIIKWDIDYDHLFPTPKVEETVKQRFPSLT